MAIKMKTKIGPRETAKLSNLIDEGGDLEKKAKKIKANPIHEQLTEKKNELKTLLSSALDPASDRTQNGGRYKAKVGAVSVSRQISDMHKIREMLGDELFMELVKIALGDIDKYLNPEQIAEVVESERNGTRSLTVTPIK